LFEEDRIIFVVAVTDEYFLLAYYDAGRGIGEEKSIFLYIYYGCDDLPDNLQS
jgi:hypothetical protein